MCALNRAERGRFCYSGTSSRSTSVTAEIRNLPGFSYSHVDTARRTCPARWLANRPMARKTCIVKRRKSPF